MRYRPLKPFGQERSCPVDVAGPRESERQDEGVQSRLTKWLVAGLTFVTIIVMAKASGLLTPGLQRLPDDQATSGRCMLWFVGSSSIHRWSGLDRDMAPWVAHNRGIEGAKLDDIVPLFEETRQSEGRPAAVILYAGENDIASGQDYHMVIRNLARFAIIKDRKYKGVPLFVLSMKPSPGRKANFAQQQLYNAAARMLAPQLPDTHYVDITTPLLKDNMPRAHYQEDGIHMTAEGYAIWARVIRSALAQKLPSELLQKCDGGK